MAPMIKRFYYNMQFYAYISSFFGIDQTVHRGCIKDLSKADYEKCVKEKKCTLCMEDTCNNDIISSSSVQMTANCLIVAFIACITFLLNQQ